jgi:hypothetical protein
MSSSENTDEIAALEDAIQKSARWMAQVVRLVDGLNFDM